MMLTVIAPCYNERRFIKGFLANCRRFADRVIISEGGSTDGTRDELATAHTGWLQVLEHPQSADPMRDFWDESERRQALVDAVEEGYIIALDIDEMLPDNVREMVEDRVDTSHHYKLEWFNFWRSPNWIRVGTEDEPDWGPTYKTRIWPAGSVTVGTEQNHTTYACNLPGVSLRDIPVFHYHYLYGQPKTFENQIHGWMAVPSPDANLRHISHYPGLLADGHPSALALTETENARWTDMTIREAAKP